MFALVLILATACRNPIEGQLPGDCSDRADSDADGFFDCDDDGCAGSPECRDEADTDADTDADSDSDADSDTDSDTDPRQRHPPVGRVRLVGLGTAERGGLSPDGRHAG